MDQSSPQPDRDLSDEERKRMFEERYARALADLRVGMGPLSVAPVQSPGGIEARLSLENPLIRPFVNVDPLAQDAIQSYGAATGRMGPEGGYEVMYTYDPQTKVPVVSGAYRKRLDKDSEITAQGSYVPLPGKDAYQAMMQYRQRFAQGGPVMRQAGSPEGGEMSKYQQDLNQYITEQLAAGATIPVERMRTLAGEQEESATPVYRNPSELAAYMSAVVPGLKVQKEKMPLGLLGEVSSAEPGVMKVNKDIGAGLEEATKLHELEHVLKNRAVQGAEKKIDNDVRFDQLYGDTSGNKRKEIVDLFIKNRDKIEQFFGRRLDDYFSPEARKSAGRSYGAMFEEQIATLSALEQMTGKSLTKSMPELFPDDKAAAIYDAITGLRQTRLDAKDLPPYTPQYQGTMDWIKGKLRMRADGSPEYGEVAEQMTVGTRPTDQGSEPSLARQGLDLIKQAGQTVYGNLREAVTDPVAFNKRALGNVAKQLQENPEEFVMNWTGGGLGGIIKPKGGNVFTENINKAISELRPQTGTGLYASEYLDALKKTATLERFESLPAVRKETLQQRIKAAEPQAALDDWVQNKLGRYIKTEMGSEADPVRKLADEMSEKVKADYQSGLKRIAKMKEDIAKAKAKGKNTDASEAALEDEIERVEEAFRNTSMLPIQLGPYTHPAARTGEAREKAGFSPFPVSKSNLGKQWEEDADSYFIPHRVGDLVDANSPAVLENPWIKNLNPDDIVYDVSPYVGEKQMFTHTIDELSNALHPNTNLPLSLRLKPEDMQQLSIEKAFRHVNKINDWRMQQRVQASLEEANRAAVTVKEYPDSPRKLQWQELKAPTYTELPRGYSLQQGAESTSLMGPDGKLVTELYGDPNQALPEALEFLSKNDLERALKYEGSTMKHCVGGYCDDVYYKQSRIFSLRDNKGEPHVTIETAPADIRVPGNTPADFLAQNPEVGARIGLSKDDIRKLSEPGNYSYDLDYVQANRNLIATPEFQQWLNSKPQNILQIKGKNNAKPNEKYIPFVQDFVRSGNWSRVGDLANTDFVELKPQMLQSLQNKGIEVNVTEIAGTPHVTKEEFNRLADLIGGINKYAQGGEVLNFIKNSGKRR